MKYIRRSENRGFVNMGWLQSKHSFSFGDYYDPRHMGISVLRVINDDIVKPGEGFGTHGHRDMEIISYVVSGAVKHEDSEGNKYIIPAGDVQRMSAGTGIMHSEYNPSDTDPVNFLQIWILPQYRGIKPSYEQKTIVQKGNLTPIVTPDGKDGSLVINQDASLYRLVLKQGETAQFSMKLRVGYLHVVKGKVIANDKVFSSGDAFALDIKETVKVEAMEDSEAIWFDLPPAY